MTSGGQDTQALLDALASPVRREILWLIWDTEMAAGDVAATFELSAPTISGHLAVLREAGLVDMRRDGTFRRYRARPDAMPGLRDIVRLDDGKWHPGSTPAPLAAHRTMAVAVAEVDAACDQATAYRAFTDARLYSRWAGVPVTLDDGRFSCTMEWGLNVRGTYDIVAPPSLIVMRWDFESDQVPLPGDGLRAYLEFPAATGRMPPPASSARAVGGAGALHGARLGAHAGPLSRSRARRGGTGRGDADATPAGAVPPG